MVKPSPMAFFTKVHDSSGKNKLAWLLDNKAINYLTSDEDNLANATPYVGYEGVVVGNRSLLPISQVWIKELNLNHYKLLLSDILHSP